MKKIKVIIACGSGAVTSTMCSGIIQGLAKENKVPVEVTTCSAMEFEPQIKNYDVKFTTMPYKFPENENFTMCISPLVTGINIADCKRKIAALLVEAASAE